MIYRTIREFKNFFRGAIVYIIGTGATLDYWLSQGGKDKCPGISITLNRACIAVDHAEFNFFDTPASLKACRFRLNSLNRIVLPIFSRGELVLEHSIVNTYLDKIFFYVWDYKGWNNLNPDMFNENDDGNNVLNDWKLFIENGNIQSTVLFAKFIGASKINFVGCNSWNGHLYSNLFCRLEERSLRRNRRQERRYEDCNRGLIKILNIIKMPYEFINPPSL